MNFFSWFLVGTAVGSAVAYFLDPVRGKTRRVTAKDKSIKFKKDSNQMIQRFLIHLKNKTQGLRAKAQRSANKDEPVSDRALEARIRSEFGRIVRHSKAITVSSQNGVVTLSGPILRKEVNDTISHVKKVPGVKYVVNKLDAHATSDNIPELQGHGPDYLQ